MSYARPETAATADLGLDLIESHHTRIHVLVDVAVVHPCTRVVGNHVYGLHLCGVNGDHVGTVPTVHHYVAMPVGSVDVADLSDGDRIPSHPLALLHDSDGHVREHEAVDGRAKIRSRKACAVGKKTALVIVD